MKRYVAVIVAVIGCVSAVNARMVQGVVLSLNDSTALAGASCRLMSEGKLITGVATAQDGAFSLSTDIKATLNLEVSLAGYSSTSIIIESGAKNVNVGAVYLDEGRTLGEVEVTGNSVVHSDGRTIVYPSAADVRASSTSLALFQKLPLPGLMANPITRSIQVDGGSPVILINGVPSSLDDMNSLLPKDIEKIEYSRFTPARYADKGNSGFINVILKKRNDGGNIYIWGRSAVNTAFVDGNVRASYHQGPSEFTLTYTPSWRNYQKVYDHVTESLIGNDFRVDMEESDRNPFYYHTHKMQLRYNYSPTIKTLFSATFSATPSISKNRAIGNIMDSELGDYSNDNETKSNNFSPSLDLFLHQDFNDKNSLEVQVVGTLSTNDYRRDNNYLYADGKEDSYIMNVDSRRRSLISEVSYIHNFSEKTQLSAGYQNTVSRSTNTYLDSDYKPLLTENNNYIYARLGQRVGKVYFSLSTGAKLYWIKNDLNKRHFVGNLSMAQVSWNISRKWNINGVFQYAPSIPSLSSLTDYPQQSTPYLVSNGNPDLKVADNFVAKITPSFQYKKFNASLSFNYGQINKAVMQDMTYLGDRLFLSQSINARKYWYTASILNLKLSEIAGFGMNLSLGLYHEEMLGQTWSHHLTTFDGSFTLWWNKGPFTISYWRRIPGKDLYGHVVSRDENGDSLQFEYTPNKHWSFGASWMYMFDKKGTRYPNWNYSEVNPSVRDRYIKNNSNMVTLSITYNADFGSIFRTANRSLRNTDNGSSLLQM